MRQIKFRIWLQRGKRMMYDSGLAVKGCKIIEESSTNLMQFIGLIDKNGKEIYEGDILQCGDSEMIVEYDETNAQFGLKSGDKRLADYYKDKSVFVVDNIYQNPEKLNLMKRLEQNSEAKDELESEIKEHSEGIAEECKKAQSEEQDG